MQSISGTPRGPPHSDLDRKESFRDTTIRPSRTSALLALDDSSRWRYPDGSAAVQCPPVLTDGRTKMVASAPARPQQHSDPGSLQGTRRSARKSWETATNH